MINMSQEIFRNTFEQNASSVLPKHEFISKIICIKYVCIFSDKDPLVIIIFLFNWIQKLRKLSAKVSSTKGFEGHSGKEEVMSNGLKELIYHRV